MCALILLCCGDCRIIRSWHRFSFTQAITLSPKQFVVVCVLVSCCLHAASSTEMFADVDEMKPFPITDKVKCTSQIKRRQGQTQ